jgi:hypothetical protein
MNKVKGNVLRMIFSCFVYWSKFLNCNTSSLSYEWKSKFKLLNILFPQIHWNMYLTDYSLQKCKSKTQITIIVNVPHVHVWGASRCK